MPSQGSARRVAQALFLATAALIAFATIVKLGDAPFLDTLELQCHDHLRGQQKLAEAGWSWFPLGLRCQASSPAGGITVVRQPSSVLSVLLVVPLGLILTALRTLTPGPSR